MGENMSVFRGVSVVRWVMILVLSAFAPRTVNGQCGFDSITTASEDPGFAVIDGDYLITANFLYSGTGTAEPGLGDIVVRRLNDLVVVGRVSSASLGIETLTDAAFYNGVLLAGDPFYDTTRSNGRVISNAGGVHMIAMNGTPQLLGTLTADKGDDNEDDLFGFQVEVNDEYIFVGAPGESTGAGGVKSGSVYVFPREALPPIDRLAKIRAANEPGARYGTFLAESDGLIAVGPTNNRPIWIRGPFGSNLWEIEHANSLGSLSIRGDRVAFTEGTSATFGAISEQSTWLADPYPYLTIPGAPPKIEFGEVGLATMIGGVIEFRAGSDWRYQGRAQLYDIESGIAVRDFNVGGTLRFHDERNNPSPCSSCLLRGRLNSPIGNLRASFAGVVTPTQVVTTLGARSRGCAFVSPSLNCGIQSYSWVGSQNNQGFDRFGLGGDFDGNGVPSLVEIWLGAEDCNGDCIADPEEFAVDPAMDCDLSGRLDSCEIDEASQLDVVVVFDTSGSLNNEAVALCGSVSALVNDLFGAGFDPSVSVLAINNSYSTQDFPCISNSVINLLGSSIPGGGVITSNEDWAGGAAIVAERFAWGGDNRVVVVLSDECAEDGGSPCDAADLAAVANAVSVCNGNGVQVIGVATDGASPDVIAAMEQIGSQTGGRSFVSEDPSTDLVEGISDAVRSVTSSADCDGDGVLNSCEIASGLEADCNGNGIPDSCEVNFAGGSNGIGGVLDCDADGLLDSCQVPGIRADSGIAPPLDGASPLSVTVPAAPNASQDATITVEIAGELPRDRADCPALHQRRPLEVVLHA
jgi:hypothetical protein